MGCRVKTYMAMHNLRHAPPSPPPPPFLGPFTAAPAHNTISLPCANIIQGRYRYIDDLVQLATVSTHSPVYPWPRYHTPIQLQNLSPFLACHPDQAFASYIYNGLTAGFRIGFGQESTRLRSRDSNHPSSLSNRAVVEERITAEVASDRLYGPLPNYLTPQVHVSPLGLVPKAHQTNKWRLIVDLSCPTGGSINDGIAPSLCSLRYASVDDAVRTIRYLGRNTQLVKLDVKDAYRIMPVHPADYHLLGIRWEGKTYVDRSLPFGLRSAHKIFSALADFIAWVLHCHAIPYQLHYLDDFLFLVPPSSHRGVSLVAEVSGIFRMLGVPVATHKTEGPSTTLVFLGILIDTHALELRLPIEKLTRLQELIQSWSGRRSCTRRELESLLGSLSHAATVITQGRTFLRQLFSLLALDRAPHHYIRLNTSAKADLLWWKVFLQEWNGSSFFPSIAPFLEVFSDASGSYGCGGFAIPHGWFQLRWPQNWHTIPITAKELVPIVIAAAIWGPTWKRCRVRFRSDNMAVVDLLSSRTSKDQLLMHLLRCLVFYAAFFRFEFVGQHVPGVLNTAADAISRNKISLFLSLVPQIPCIPIPQPVLNLLVTRKPDWGSQGWTQLFAHSLLTESPRPPGQCTSQDGVDI